MAAMAWLRCMVMEHSITWSLAASASPASAHRAIASISIAVSTFRIELLALMIECLLWRRGCYRVCDAGHWTHFLRRSPTQNVLFYAPLHAPHLVLGVDANIAPVPPCGTAEDSPPFQRWESLKK